MKFIFPKNYNFKPKLFGFIEYSTAIFNIIYAGILFFIINYLFKNISIKIYLCIGLYFPVLLFSFFGVNNENIIDIIRYMFKFIKKQKIILYKKQKKFT